MQKTERAHRQTDTESYRISETGLGYCGNGAVRGRECVPGSLSCGRQDTNPDSNSISPSAMRVTCSASTTDEESEVELLQHQRKQEKQQHSIKKREPERETGNSEVHTSKRQG